MIGQPPNSLIEVERLRRAYRPEPVEVLLVGESPPDPGAGAIRFFYSPELRIDNLYRGVVEAVYGLDRHAVRKTPKPELLERLRQDGFWLIDAVQKPINHLPPRERRRAIHDGVPNLVELCLEIAPRSGVVICHAGVYWLAADHLREAGLRLLHDSPIPFPLGSGRESFVRGLGAALSP